MRAPTPTTLRQAWDAWLAGAKEGTIRTRSGDRYKPSALRSYESAMRLRMLDELGGSKLSDIPRVQVQDFADGMIAGGLDPSTVRNALMPLRAIFRRAVSRGEIAVNPTAGIELPAVRGKRDRIASPTEAAALVEALEEDDRALWATAFYAGLRLGELRALRDEDVDLETGVVRVERAWDPKEGPIEPKSRAGRRSVPIVASLRSHLAARRLRRGGAEGLFFGEGERPFDDGAAHDRARKAWRQLEARLREADPKASVQTIGFHEARHTCASLFIAAGVNAKALSTYLGHSSIQITLDRYGHLMPGNEVEAVALVDAYLERATSARQSLPAVNGSQRV
jgi:integrase